MDDTPSPPSVPGLVAGLQKARRKRLREVTGETDYDRQQQLGDRCLRNAYVLAETLQEHECDPIIICGGVADQAIGQNGIRRSTLPTTIERCRDHGEIHYWVETACRTYTLDLAGEFPEGDPNRYKPFIARSVPPNYYYLEDGIDYTFEIPPV